jgi:hypothetical protein
MWQPSEYLEGVRPGDSSATSLLHVPDPHDVGGNLAVIEAIPSFSVLRTDALRLKSRVR